MHVVQRQIRGTKSCLVNGAALRMMVWGGTRANTWSNSFQGLIIFFFRVLEMNDKLKFIQSAIASLSSNRAGQRPSLYAFLNWVGAAPTKKFSSHLCSISIIHSLYGSPSRDMFLHHEIALDEGHLPLIMRCSHRGDEKSRWLMFKAVWKTFWDAGTMYKRSDARLYVSAK